MLNVAILPQPDDVTCGPTSLHAVYRYFGDEIGLEQVIREVPSFEDGGTIAVWLGTHAMRRGYQATLYTYSLSIFDPSWQRLPRSELIGKLQEQLRQKNDEKFAGVSQAYIDFLQQEGTVLFDNLNVSLLRGYFTRQIPVLAGLSSTYLYNSVREISVSATKTVADDIRGTPAGHFVVLCGYDEQRKRIVVADPYKENPVSRNHYYAVGAGRLINSILLGVVTYDATLLIIEPKRSGQCGI